MNRNYQLNATHLITDQDLIRQIAFHEAGHASAIYLYNKQRQLPPVFFEIKIKKALDRPKNSPVNASSLMTNDSCVAVVEGGRLIPYFPVALIDSAQYYSTTEQDVYRTAFEADIINLLTGSLTEAKYVALRDNEPFNAHLVNINALHYYGGSSDLEKIDESLGRFIATKSQQEKKMSELFNKAFQFISSPVHWQAIECLADYILNNRENTISCEEAIAVLDNSIKEAWAII